jgi:hypothetical protein
LDEVPDVVPSAAAVFPKPETIDPRLVYLQEALTFDPAKAVGGKKRKRARTFQGGFGVGPTAAGRARRGGLTETWLVLFHGTE